jgi:hypothetical protein
MSEQLPLKSLTGNADPVRRRPPPTSDNPVLTPGAATRSRVGAMDLRAEYAGMTGSYPWARTARSHSPVRLLSEINRCLGAPPDLLTTTRTKAGSLEDR